jgi:ATP phosphoribosyltransferase regulatory subunit
MIANRNAADHAVTAFLAARGLTMPAIPMLQPADPFLDTAGEALRRRIFLTEGERGESLCLRPEFTIPVCMHHIASASGTPARYGYCGPVFRQRREAGSEFLQAGIEDLGDADDAAADARCLADALALIAHARPGAQTRVTLGDEALFAALLAALTIPRPWQARLIRLFGDKAKLDAALAQLAAPARETQRFAGLGRAAIIAALEAEMEEAGLLDAAGRTPQAIADRLLVKRELAGEGLPGEARRIIRAFLALEAPLPEAVPAIKAFADRAAVSLDGALARFQDRLHAMTAAGVDAGAIMFSASFGRPLDYYSAMQFEIYGASDQPVIGGGRYDRLMTLLGAAKPIPAVGFSVWLDRLEPM